MRGFVPLAGKVLHIRKFGEKIRMEPLVKVFKMYTDNCPNVALHPGSHEPGEHVVIL